MRYTFVHAADLHLDTPFAGIGQLSPDLRDVLQNASLQAFDALVDLTIREQARFLLLAGDVYDGNERGIRAQQRFLRGLERLSERGISTFVVHGNHDSLSGWSAIREWPRGVTVFGPERVESLALSEGTEVFATVHGISYPRVRMEENLSVRFHRGENPGIHLGLLHANVAGNGEHAPYCSCTLDDLRQAGMDYWALGHVHRRQVLCAEPWVVYPGNIQGRSPKPSEMGAKGAFVVTVQGNRIQEPRFEVLDRIRFVSLELDLSQFSHSSDFLFLERALLAEGERLREAHEGRSLIVRATLVGRGPLYGELIESGRLQELLGLLRQDCLGGSLSEGFVWWEDLRNAASPPLDLEQIRRRGDFSSELMRLSEERKQDPARREAFLQEQLSPLERFKGLIPKLTPEESLQLLREAEMLALELLERN